MKKLNTCEEGGANLRISFGHLLMNLKNNYLFKKLLKWANKKQNNFNIYNVAFFEKNKEKQPEISLFYKNNLCTKNLNNITYTVPEI